MSTVWLLSLMVEEFGLDYDATTIDQQNKLVEIHQPDGRNDALQQVEHGLLSVLGAYQSLGRLYRGIITPTIRQYVMLGDASAQTDNKVHDKNDKSSVADDRQVFSAIGLVVFTCRNTAPKRKSLSAISSIFSKVQSWA
jgi:endoglucanase